jgi:hypothetical protein
MSSAPAILDALPPARPRRRHFVAAGILLAGIGVLLLAGRDRDPVATPRLVVDALVHWQDDGHDWLLVADRASHELVVYDAATGEALQRLGRDDGLGSVDTIAALGDQLLVQDTKGQPTLLSLPSLRAQALASR